jgi:hypothetical protein
MGKGGWAMTNRAAGAPVVDLDAALLAIAFRHRVRAANADEGRQHIEALLGRELDSAAFAEAVARCLAARLIHDPVRLSAGDLQCHWDLELTVAGVEGARPGALPLDLAKGGHYRNP